MAYEVEFTGEFHAWWENLTEDEQRSVAHYVRLLEQKGPQLPFPYSSKVESSRHGAMRELRIQHRGDPYRVLYIFDPRRTAVLLFGGNKTGDDRWHVKTVPEADDIYDRYLRELEGGQHAENT